MGSWVVDAGKDETEGLLSSRAGMIGCSSDIPTNRIVQSNNQQDLAPFPFLFSHPNQIR